MEVEVEHGLGREQAAERVQAAAQKHGVEIEASPDGTEGTLVHAAPLVGKVRARYTVTDSALRVEVLDRPRLIPEGVLRRMIEEEIGKLLA